MLRSLEVAALAAASLANRSENSFDGEAYYTTNGALSTTPRLSPLLNYVSAWSSDSAIPMPSGLSMPYSEVMTSTLPIQPLNASKITTTVPFSTPLMMWSMYDTSPSTTNISPTSISGNSYTPEVTGGFTASPSEERTVYVTVTVDDCPTSSSAPSSSFVSSWTPSSSPACPLPTSPLTNEQQVGDSILGTLCQPKLPHWLDDNQGTQYVLAPWGERNTTNADGTIQNDVPTTGVTRYYNFTVSRGQISPDGVLTDVILINNQFPGPLVEANWGDMIEVTVVNNITNPDEGTSIHWHGMLQRGTPWYDGVPASTQCPIAPGSSFTYTFQAEMYGSSWYHAHYSAQYTAGVAGPMVIHGPTQLQYDIDVGPVMLSDWHHIPYFSVVNNVVGTNLSLIPPTSDNLLINGRSNFNCSQPSYSSNTDWLATNVSANMTWTCVEWTELSKFRFQPGKTHRLRLMNTGADGIQKFSIDGHIMTVIATDFIPTIPYTTDVVTLGVGQRTDVLITADNYSESLYWMRSQAPGGEMCGGSSVPEALAAVYYEGADTTSWPASISTVNDTSCDNQPLNFTQPEFAMTPSENAYYQDVILSIDINDTGSFQWLVNGQSFHGDFSDPLLFLAAEGNTSYPNPEWNVYNFNQNGSVVLNITNFTPDMHPFHLHGHSVYVLNVGPAGTVWDGSIVNPTNPMRRDTQIIPAWGYAALMFEANNPGVWPLHCHTAWHLSGGLSLNVLTQPQDIPAIPSGMYWQTCAAWNEYASSNFVDQIDAGS